MIPHICWAIMTVNAVEGQPGMKLGKGVRHTSQSGTTHTWNCKKLPHALSVAAVFEKLVLEFKF